MSGSRPTAALLVVLSLLAAATPSHASAHPPAVTAARPLPPCQTVITITQAPASPTAQTSASVTVEYGEVVTTGPACLSVAGGESFAFTVNGVDRTSFFTYGYNATTERNEAYGTNVPLIVGMTNTLVATTYGGRPAGDVGTVSATAQVLVTASVAVTPDNMAADVRPLRQNTQRFTLVNGPTATSYTLTASCTGTATGCAPTASSIQLAAGVSASVGVTYQAGPTGTTGTVKLLATWPSSTAVKDSGWVTVTVRSVGSAVATVDLVNPGTSIERDLCLTIAMGSGAASECGDLRLTYALPTTRTKNKARTPTLLYNSQHAHPYPLIAANVTIPSTVAPPDSVTAKVFFGPTLKASGTWAGTDFVTGGTRRIVLGFDALTNPTGLYPYTLEVKSWYDTDLPYTQTVASTLVIVNRSYLGSGAGWWIAGVEYLYFPGSSQILWVGGDGSTRLYQPAPSTMANGATRCNWAAETLDRPDTLSSDCGETYTRHAPHGVKVEFDGSGRHVRTINRLKDTTSFYWHPTLQRVESIRIPPTPANLSYSFSYNATSGFLDSIVAPPAGTQRRVIRVSTDLGMVFNPGSGNMSGGRITALRGPDTSRVQFAYVSTSYRAQSRTDRRGTVRTFTYDAGQRVTRDSLAMGAGSTDVVTAFQPQETQGLMGSSRPTATDTAFVSSFMDGPRSLPVGDTTRFWLTRWGAPRRIRNALGYETSLSFGDSRWPALATLVVAPNGRKQSAAYDTRGNLVSTTDSSSSVSGVYATTSYAWDSMWDLVTWVDPPAHDSVRIVYDAVNGNRLWQQDARGAASRVNFTYFTSGIATGQLATIKTPIVPATSMTYDSLGNPRSATSPRGMTTTTYKDALGRDTLVVSPVDTVATQFARQSTTYDFMDRAIASVTAAAPDSIFVAQGFDPDGNLLSVSRRVVPDLAAIGTSLTQWRYDAGGRRVAEVAPDGYVDSTAYDPASNVVAAVTRRGHTITMQYDALSRLSRRIVPEVSKLDTTANGWTFPRYPLPTFADTATFAYDSMGNITTADNRDARITRAYNQNGTLLADTLRVRTYADLSAGGDFTSHVYGVRHRYDLAGRRTATLVPRQLGARYAAAPSVIYDSMAYSYTSFGALRTARDVLGNVFTYAYDLDGRVDTLFYPLGDFKRYTYNSDDSPTLIHEDRTASGNQSQNNDIQARYDARGKIIELNPNTNSSGWQPLVYSGLGALIANNQKSLVFNQITPRDNTDSNSVDPLGNIARVQSKHSYSYYMTCAAGSVAADVYGYASDLRQYAPATGRLLMASDTAGELQQSSNIRCRSRSSGATRRTRHLYDRAGNEYWTATSGRDSTTEVGGLKGVTNTFTREAARYLDAEGRVRAADVRASAAYSAAPFYQAPPAFEEYRYDALGRRVLRRARQLQASTPGEIDQIQRFVWDGSHLVAEVQYPGSDAATSVLERDTVTLTAGTGRYFGRVLYLTGEGIDRPVSIVRMGYGEGVGGEFTTWDPLAMSPRWDVQSRGYDAAFYGPTPVCRTVSGDTKCARIVWPARRAYGMIIGGSTYAYHAYDGWWGSLAQDQMDATANLYRRNRYYDQSTGRFTQEDPIGLAGGLNLYGFANGDPVNFSDPFGLCFWDLCLVEGAAAYALAGAAITATVFVATQADNIRGFAEALGAAVSGIVDRKGNSGKDAPGQTAGGRATDEYGNVLGPSGKPARHGVNHPTEKGAKEAAARRGKGAPVKHSSPTRGKPHFQPTDEDGKKIPNSTHHNFPP